MAEKLWETAPDNAFIKDLRGLCIALTWRFALALKCHGPRKEFPPNYVLGRSHFYHHWEHWRTRMVTDPEFQPAHALSGPAQDLKENIPDVSITLAGDTIDMR